MSLVEVANEDLKVNFQFSAGPPDMVYTVDPGIDPVSIVATKSTTTKAAGKFVCTTGLTITWTLPLPCPYTSATYDFVSGVASLIPPPTKTKVDGATVLRKDDQSISGCIGSWTLKISPFTAMPCICACKIADAGQTKVKAQ